MIREFIIFPVSFVFCLLFIADHNAFTDVRGFLGIINFIWQVIVCGGLAMIPVIVSLVFRFIAFVIDFVIDIIKEVIYFLRTNGDIRALLGLSAYLLNALFFVLHIIFLCAMSAGSVVFSSLSVLR